MSTSQGEAATQPLEGDIYFYGWDVCQKRWNKGIQRSFRCLRSMQTQSGKYENDLTYSWTVTAHYNISLNSVLIKDKIHYHKLNINRGSRLGFAISLYWLHTGCHCKHPVMNWETEKRSWCIYFEFSLYYSTYVKRRVHFIVVYHAVTLEKWEMCSSNCDALRYDEDF